MKLYKLCIIFFYLCFNQSLSAKRDKRPRLPKYTYDLAMCAIFQNEAQHLKEWIEFHKLVGFQHFILYNNYSTDNYEEVLKPYIHKKEVELINWPIHATPNNPSWVLSAYNDAIAKNRHKIKWMAFLDVDEFIFPVREDNLINFLKSYEKYGALCANWAMYGTSHVKSIKQNELLIEKLTLRANDNYSVNVHVKSIVRTDKIRKMVSQHFGVYRKGFSQVNADHLPFTGPFSPYTSFDKIRINHYWTRDETNLYQVKIPRREQDMGQGADITLKLTNDLNDMHDKSIYKYIGPLKEAIFK